MTFNSYGDKKCLTVFNFSPQMKNSKNSYLKIYIYVHCTRQI